MKKDLFNGNIKKEYVSYIGLTIMVAAVAFFGCGGFFVGISFSNLVADQATALFCFVLGVISILMGIFYISGVIFVIRTYPKYQKYAKWFFNSEYYFVGCESKEYNGLKRGRAGRKAQRAFATVTGIAELEKRYEGITYPKKMKWYRAFAVVGIFLSFLYIGFVYAAIEKMELLPLNLQNENLILGILTVLEVLTMASSLFLAFRVRKIREQTRMEFEKKQF